jgi:Flp pilus assembly protein TadB
VLHAGLHPFPFHVLAVVLHALVSALVFALAQQLFAVLEQQQRSATKRTSSGGGAGTAAAVATLPGGSAWTADADSAPCQQQQQQQPQEGLWLGLTWRVPASSTYRASACVAALLFALHPIHTEVGVAVAVWGRHGVLPPGGVALG